ncbi:hypothetical protein VTN96DRAFT_9739 [Rasamsonia emersonii]
MIHPLGSGLIARDHAAPWTSLDKAYLSIRRVSSGELSRAVGCTKQLSLAFVSTAAIPGIPEGYGGGIAVHDTA